MSISEFTLNNLYNQGIIDYVPYDLVNNGMGAGMCGMNAQAYMNSAMQGAMYQNYGMTPDSFNHTNSVGYNNYGTNNFNQFGGIGENTFSNNPQAGINGFGGVNGNTFANNPQAGINGFGGGFGKLGAQTSSFVNSIPKSVLGIISGALIIGTTILCLKGKKKPPAKNGGFWSKLKFWKKPQKQAPVQKESFWSKLKFWKKK